MCQEDYEISACVFTVRYIHMISVYIHVLVPCLYTLANLLLVLCLLTNTLS